MKNSNIQNVDSTLIQNPEEDIETDIHTQVEVDNTSLFL